MSKDVLSNKELRDFFAGPHQAFMARILGERGRVELAAFNKYLRHESPSSELVSAKPKTVRRTKIVDLSASPYVPDGYRVTHHRVGKKVKARISPLADELCLDGEPIKLWLSDSQQEGTVHGYDLLAEMGDKPVLNANLLDWLLRTENQRFIPEPWKGQFVFFWGTVYENQEDFRNIRYLYWNLAGYWDWTVYWLGSKWDKKKPSAQVAA